MHTSPAVAADLTNCPHERGPGTTTCLRCRADAHRAASAARRKVALQGGIAVVGIAAVLAMGTMILATRGNSTPAPAAAAPAGTGSVGAAPAPGAAVTPALRAAPLVAAQVPLGRTELGAGMFVERSAEEIVVHFDTPVFRTRRPEKFEQVVRATLPEVYGVQAQRVLDAIADGALTGDGDLLADLPVRGVTLPAQDGVAITIHPGTRPGQDGPLVVRYRVTATAARS